MGRPWWVLPLQVVVGAYLLYGLVAGVLTGAADGGPGRALLVAAIHLAGLGCWALVLRRRTAPFAVLAASAVLGLAAHWLAPFSGTTLLYAVVWLAPFRTRLWQALLLTVLTTGGFVLVSLDVGLDPSANYGIAAGLGWAVYIAAVVNQLATTKRQTAAVAAARADAAVLAERQRMAREIHDIVAHSLAAQVVHLEGTRMLLERDGDREQALERVRQAGDFARAGLAETTLAVAALRGQHRPLAGELAGLAGDFRATTGNPCELTVEGDPDVLAPPARLAVVRTVREALTNVHKHAPAASVTIRLRCGDDGCELDVRDTGGTNGGVLAATGSGYGLVGMRERAELVGGSLDAGPHGPGFRVQLRMPGP
ncbi:sensor histidine kinase [Actinophytocola xinjiangensis]|nr:histidine kinase [Actinophytocola xinjiangensis]